MRNKMNLDMGVLMTDVKGTNVITLDLGISERGDPIYGISWFNGRQWGATPTFEYFNDAYAMYKLIRRMI